MGSRVITLSVGLTRTTDVPRYPMRARTSANFSGIDAMGWCEEGSRSTLSAIAAICS
jgi:hypothetical protein